MEVEMMRRIWKPLVFVSLVGVLVSALYLQVSSLERRPVGTGIGELAPNFTGTTLEGESISLSDFRGQIVLVNDSTVQCRSCPTGTSYLAGLNSAEPGDIVCIDLNRQGPGAKEANFEEQSDLPHILLLNPDGKATEIYQSVGLPTSWFVDSEGTVRYVHAGPMTAATLNETLDAIREGREPIVYSSVSVSC
jgi:peroxiredoxin